MSFAQPRYSFDEDGVTGSVDVTLTGVIDVPVTVNVRGGVCVCVCVCVCVLAAMPKDYNMIMSNTSLISSWNTTR